MLLLARIVLFFGAVAVLVNVYRSIRLRDKRQAASGKRQAASGKRQAASGKRQAASGKRQAASGKRHSFGLPEGSVRTIIALI